MATKTSDQGTDEPLVGRDPIATSAGANEQRSLRILFLIDELEAPHGGSEQQVIQLIQLLSGAGEQVELAILRGTEWLTEKESGCPVHFCHVGSITSPSGMWALGKFARWMRHRKFDVLQTMFVEANLLGPLLAKIAGVPVVLGSRRNLNYWMSRRMALLQGISNRLATRLVANSQAVKRVVAAQENTSESKVDVLYNGIDCGRFAHSPELRVATRRRFGIPDGAFLIGCVSSFRPVKGMDILIRAAAIVNQNHDHSYFILVGNGPTLPEMRQLASYLNLGNRCVFVDAQRDVVPFLSAFDAGVLPSRSEGFSNSLLEYMAAGLPVVATDVGGNRETVEDTALLVTPDPEAMANAISALITDRSLSERVASAALERVCRHFNLDYTRARIYQYFHDCATKYGALNRH
jgi:glycosyltransferase involved in cell wall biosynthesis